MNSSNVKSAMLIGTAIAATLASSTALAHHTYSHQRAGDVHLVSTKDIQIFVIDREKGKTCSYLIPRKKGKRQYGVNLGGKDCPKDAWVNVLRGKNGIYTLAPVRSAKKPLRVSKPLKLEPVKGPAYDTFRKELAVANIASGMNAEGLADYWKQHFNADLKLEKLDVEMLDARLKPKGFSFARSEKDTDGVKEVLEVVTHEDGADGYYNSEPNSVVVVNHRTTIQEGMPGTLDKAISELKQKYGEPANVEEEKWPASEDIREVTMKWAINADGSRVGKIDRWAKCGSLKTYNLRGYWLDEDGKRHGSRWINMVAHDFYSGNDAVLPGECVLYVEAVIGAWPGGKLNKKYLTLTDAGLLTDIYNKTFFDIGKKMSEKIKVPKKP